MASVNPIRIRLRYADMETFVEKFAPNVTRGGVFLASRNIQPIGTIVPFEIQLLGGETALSGEGRVSWTKEFNPTEPNRPYGMGMQFVNIAPASKPVLARLLQAREVAGAGRGTTTGPLAPLGTSTTASEASGPNGNSANRRPAQGKGAPVAKPIDTSVDLAAEYGVAEQTMRRLMERKWLMGARANDDDLSDLLRPDPVEAATLSQALSELPRLLDPQYSRRRTSSALRSLDWRGSPAQPVAVPVSPANQYQAEATGQATGDDGVVQQVVPSSAQAGQEEGEDTGRNPDADPEADPDADDSSGPHPLSTPGHASVGHQPSSPHLAGDPSETTDLTGEHELEPSLQAIPPVPAVTRNGHSDRKRR